MNFIGNLEQKVKGYVELLKAYDYNNILKRGFIFAKSKKGDLIKTAKEFKQVKEADLVFIDGKVRVIENEK